VNTGAGRDPAEGLVRTIQARGVRDPRVLEAFRRVRREGFVPPELTGLAYRDEPIPIPHGQVTSQPSLIAQMVAALRLTGSERVLEVGTGYGYQTAILAALAREAFSIERFADLAKRARSNLERAGIEGVTVLVGDGTLGLPEHAPYDGVVVSAAAPKVPGPLARQLAEGGRIVHPLGSGGAEVVIAFRKKGDRLVEQERLTPASFVRLIGAHGLPEPGASDRGPLSSGPT